MQEERFYPFDLTQFDSRESSSVIVRMRSVSNLAAYGLVQYRMDHVPSARYAAKASNKEQEPAESDEEAHSS